jgi:Tol biopolymer transport system component/predicted Ser/Thr protein kinase
MVGQTISHYEVLEELGRGAMGAVYKARDTLLDRVLAIKVLRSDIANTTRERRFFQEAKTASSLNHPNIVTIYEIFHVADAPCIAMEYIDGATLERHLATGPADLRKGLEWAVSIADALSKAHQAGIVHRDVKPTNIMITTSGLVKILDFGLAKMMEVSDSSGPGERLTQDGRIVGTPPYLSPEQARAEKVDARSDIFSLGAVLYEMFTGKRPFERETNVDMLSAVVRDQPKRARSIVKDLPPALDQLIMRCLEKKVERRYQRMQDVKDALEAVRQSDALARLLAARGARTQPQNWPIWASVVSLGVTLAGGLIWWGAAHDRTPKREPVLTRLTWDEGLTRDPAVSPDGRFLAYASDRGGESLAIWIQRIGGGDDVRLTRNPADDHEPAFSPDGSEIAFRSERDGGGVYLVSVLGRQTRLLARQGRRPRFSPDGKWIAYWTGFATGDPTSPGSNKIFVIPAGGGAPTQLAHGFDSALYPIWLPDSKRVLFLGAAPGAPASASGPRTGVNRPINRVDWWIAALDNSPPVKTGVLGELTKQGLSVWASSGAGIAPDLWLPSGNRVIFSASFASTNTYRENVNIWSVPLSPSTGKAVGPARQITSGTAFESSPAATPNGDIVFSSSFPKTGIWMLPVDADEGKVTGELKALTHDAAFHGQPSVSLDGATVACYATSSGNLNIFTIDVLRDRERQLTSTPFGESSPIISSDGSTVYYSIYGKREVWSQPAEGGEATKLCQDCGDWDVSRDRSMILYWYSITKPLVSIGLLSLPTGKKTELIDHPEYSLYQPHFSPDQRWIVFLAKTGQDRTRIYVTPFRGEARQELSAWIPITSGDALDDKPRWSPNGNLMYLVSERDGFRCLWAQRLDPQTKRPIGDAFAVRHFHTSRRSLMNVGFGPLETSVARAAIVFNLGEITGNLWRASMD